MSTLDLDEGEYCYKMINDAARWDERIYDWFMESESKGLEELEIYLESNSNNNYMYIEYSYKELGKDDAWLKKQEREIGSLEAVKRELLLQWTYSSSNSVFDEEVLDEVARYADKDFKSKIYFDYGRKGKFVFHVIDTMHNMMEKNWVIGVDVSGGLGRDNTAITVIDPATNKPVMHFYNNTITTDTLRRLLTELITVYMPKAVLIPERNYAGKSLIDEILNEGIIADNLFYTVRRREAEVVVQDTKEMFHRPNKKIKKDVRIYGVDTTKKTRDIMVNDILSMIINEQPELINNRALFADIKGLQYSNKGKIEHASGGHDDTLFSYLVPMYAILYERDINKFVKVKHGSSVTEDENGNKITSTSDAKEFNSKVMKGLNTINGRDDLLSKLQEEHNRIHNSQDSKNANKGLRNFNNIMRGL